MQRISVVGNSGSGKSFLASEIARLINAPHVELDGIHHLAHWEPISPDVFRLTVDEISKGESWVIDGNYRAVVLDGPVWQRADTVVWLDLPRWLVMIQVIRRTLRRLIFREVLWNGNRESKRQLISWNPEKSIIRWSWTQHAEYRQRYKNAMASDQYGHLHFHRLTSRRDIRSLTDALQ